MPKQTLLYIGLLFAGTMHAQTSAVHGDIQVGASTDISSECEQIDYTYTTEDARLGTNSGHRYFSDVDDTNRNVHLFYDADLQVDLHPDHSLAFTLSGTHDWLHTVGVREETIHDAEGNLLSRVQGQYSRPRETGTQLGAGVRYTYRTHRPGESLSVGYQYRWDHSLHQLIQQVDEATGWNLFTSNIRTQQTNYRYHHMSLDYVCPLAKGHALDLGVCYDRRQIDNQTLILWDGSSHLDALYTHLTQYGALNARYRMQVGPVQAVAGLEYRATKMQQRWLHDVLPTAMVKYQIDSVHSLTAQYRILLIRPEIQHLDTNHITDAYTQMFGSDALIGTHAHNVSLTYRMALPRLTFATEVKYITASDGINALWIESNDTRLYTWGNEGIRHAVSLTPSVDSHLGETTRLHWDATVLWDQRIAAAINMSNAQWGIRTAAELEQELPYAMSLIINGEYAYHNTLNLYSYAGHGGSIGVEWQMAFLDRHNLCLSAGYTCGFTPEVHVVKGGWVGKEIFHPCCFHDVALHISYTF